MTIGIPEQQLDTDPTDYDTRRVRLHHRLARNPLGLASLLVLGVIILCGIASPILAPLDPNEARLELTNAAPLSGDYLLGGDQAGRDILSRLMVATSYTISASCIMLLVALLLGTTAGLVAGYFRGGFDTVFSWIANAIMALPSFVLLIALYTVIGPSIQTAMAVFGILVAPTYLRLVRGLVIGVRQELYIDAAKVSGLSDLQIVARHVLRAVRAPIIIQSSFVLSAGIAIQAALEFLGLGDPTIPSWGGMLQDAFNNIYVARLNVVWPAALISVTILSLVLLGNALRDVLQTGSAPAPPSVKKSGRRRGSHAATTTTSPAAPAMATASRDPAGSLQGAGPDATGLLTVRDLAIGYPTSTGSIREVVHGVDLTVCRGEVLGLVGESGSGKSQTAFAVLDILPPQAVVLRGSITFAGEDLRKKENIVRVRGRRIAYIPQEPMSNLDPSFTVGRQLVYGLRAIRNISRMDAREQLLDLLGRVGIRDPRRTYDLYPHQISGGMAQRVLIAGAVAGDPDLIIADEPTTALDVTVQADVLDLLRDLQQERQLAMVLVTHNFGVVADICDRVSVMQQGRVVETNSAARLFREPQHAYTRGLLASTLDVSDVRQPLEGV